MQMPMPERAFVCWSVRVCVSLHLCKPHQFSIDTKKSSITPQAPRIVRKVKAIANVKEHNKMLYSLEVSTMRYFGKKVIQSSKLQTILRQL